MKANPTKHSCGQKTCPNCYKKWIYWEAIRICVKLGAEEVVRRFLRFRYRLKHVIVSPDPELYKGFSKYSDPKKLSKEEVEELKRLYGVNVDKGKFALRVEEEDGVALVGELGYDELVMWLRREAVKYLYAKSKGKLACCCIFHAYRPNDRFWEEYGGERGEEDECIEVEIKKWEWIFSKENWYDYVEFSPHFHFVGWFGWLEPPQKGEMFVYKTIMRDGKVASPKDRKELYRLVVYLLSHTATSRKGFHPVTWVGKLSYRNGIPFEILEAWRRYKRLREREKKAKGKCKACGGPLWYMEDNLRVFLKAWCDVPSEMFYRLSIGELKRIVRENERVPLKIKINVIECLEILEGKPPPYLIEEGK